MEEILKETPATEEVVAEPVAENVEGTTEQAPRTYTQEEFDAALSAKLNEKLDEVMPRKIARREAKIRKEYERKYGDLENVLRAGTGKEKVEDMTATFKDFYQKKGIRIQEKPTFSDRDNEVLAKAEADDIIRSGYDEVVDEVDRLTRLGAANMSQRDKAVFKILAEHRQVTERGMELAKMGVTEDVYNSKEFTDFASQFNPNVPVTKVYEIFNSTRPKKNIKPMGSMKATAPENNGVKDFYSFEEASKFTKKDFDNDPALYAAVQKSMHKWK